MTETTLKFPAQETAAPPQVRCQRLHAMATLPQRHSEHAAGMDLAACLPGGPVRIDPGVVMMIPCGFAMAVPVGYEAQVRPRSGLATKHAITLPNAPGTIDSDYRGEVFVPLINLGQAPFVVEHGMRIAQMVIAPVVLAQTLEVDSLDETSRGAGGFGSTGL